jgi:hypothetical protein
MFMKSATLLLLACVMLGTPGTSRATTHEATDSTSFTSALGNAQDGDRIHLSAGTYRAPSGGWVVRRSIELFGDGAGDVAAGSTRLKPNSDSQPVLVLKPPDSGGSGNLENVYIHDLQIRPDSPPGSYSSTGHGIFWEQQGSTGRNLGTLRLSRVYIRDMRGDGINLIGSDTYQTYAVGVTLADVDVEHCWGNGLNVYRGTVVALFGGYYHNNHLTGCNLSSCNDAKVIGAALEENAGEGMPQLELANAQGFLVEGCHFEEFDDGGPGAIKIGGNGGQIVGCFFGNETGTGSTGIAITNANARGVVVGPNVWSNVDVLVTITDSDDFRSCTVFPQAIYNSNNVASKIVVPEAADRGHFVFSATDNTSSLTAGLALPRLSATKRDAMTAASSGGTRREGLVIYNDTDDRLNHWDGKRWVQDVAFFPSDSTTAGAAPGGINVPSALTSSTRNNIPSVYKKKGAFFFNSNTNKLNYWDGGNWKELDGKPVNGDAP